MTHLQKPPPLRLYLVGISRMDNDIATRTTCAILERIMDTKKEWYDRSIMGETVICKSIKCRKMDMDQEYVFIPINVKGNDKLIDIIKQWLGNQKYTLFYTNGIHEGENQTR